MKICSICKSQNSDNAKFCQSCGSTSFQKDEKKDQGYFQSDFNTGMQEKEVLSTVPAINIIKKTVTDKLFTAAAIIFNIYTLLILIFGIMVSINATNIEANRNVFSIFIIILVNILDCIPNILFCLGIWMIIAAIRSKINENININGIRIIKTAIIINIVLILITFVLSEIALFTDSYSNIYAYMNDFGFSAASLVMRSIKNGIYFIIDIIYFAKILKILKTIKYTIETSLPSDAIPKYVIVMNFIYSIGSLTVIFYSFPDFLVSLCSIAFYVLFAIKLYIYRKDMNSLILKNQYSENAEKETYLNSSSTN
jgi:ribosomal protein L40E